MTDTAAKNAEKTHILWASNMDDLGYADILFLVGDEPPYGVGINCGGHIIVKPLRDWHALAAIPAPAQTPPRAEDDPRTKADNIVKQMWSVLPTKWDRDCLRELIVAALRSPAPAQGTRIPCPHDMGFDNEIGPLGCLLVAKELACVCEHMHFAIRAQVIEECAKVADIHAFSARQAVRHAAGPKLRQRALAVEDAALQIVKSIRALALPQAPERDAQVSRPQHSPAEKTGE